MLKKDHLIKHFLLLTACVSLASCQNSEPTSQAKLFYAYSTENLMATWNYFASSTDLEKEENIPYQNRDYTLRFNCIKGEYEAAQLMIHANEYINEFDFILPTLSGDNGTISADNFQVFATYYQDVDGSNESDAYSGAYPDALIPLVNYQWKRLNHIERGQNQSLFINFLSKDDMSSGTYNGEGTLKLDGTEYKIPFELRIYDAIMPKEVHQSSSFLIWYDQIEIGEKNNATPEVEMAYYNDLVRHRVAPDGLPEVYESTPEMFAEAMYTYVANNPMISTYRFPGATGDSFNIDNERPYLRALIKKNIELRKNGDSTTDLFKKLFFYVDDEPTRAKYDLVKAHDKSIFDMKKEFAPQLSAYPDLQASLLSIKNLVTVPYSENLVATNETGGVQCWCPQFQHFNAKSNRDLYASRQQSHDRDGGENVWWYGCISPATPYASYHLDADLLNSRIIDYMQYAYGIEGELYWNVCYYSKYAQGYTQGRDIWHDPITWVNCAGDGALYYPGVDFGIKGPISTLRLESILASNEEAEYLWIIEQKVNEYNQLHSTSYDVRQLLQKFFNRLFTNVRPIKDDDEFNNVRLELLNILEKFSNSLELGMALLLN